MKPDARKAWKQFQLRVDDLFQLGVSLPLCLHIPAIDDVGLRLQEWRSKVEGDESKSTDNQYSATDLSPRPSTKKRKIYGITDNSSVTVTSESNCSKEPMSPSTCAVMKRKVGRPRKKDILSNEKKSYVTKDVKTATNNEFDTRNNIRVTEEKLINSQDAGTANLATTTDNRQSDWSKLFASNEQKQKKITMNELDSNKEESTVSVQAEKMSPLDNKDCSQHDSHNDDDDDINDDETEPLEQAHELSPVDNEPNNFIESLLLQDQHESHDDVSDNETEPLESLSTTQSVSSITKTSKKQVPNMNHNIRSRKKAVSKSSTGKHEREQPKKARAKPSEPHRSVGRPLKSKTKAVKKFFCNKCSTGFTAESSLRTHMRMHESGPLTCEICSKTYHSKTGYTQHMKIHSGNACCCPTCDFVTSDKYYFKRHMIFMHGQGDVATLDSYPCDRCDKVFYTKYRLDRHVEHHIRAKVFKCDLCDYITHSKSLVQSHRKSQHMKRDPLICTICGSALKNKACLAEHMRRHSSSKLFHCDVCGTQHISAKQLAQHRLVHKPPSHMCQECGKCFKTTHHLRRHSIIHTGEKNFSCPHCDYRCNVLGNLHKHMKGVHKITPATKNLKVLKIDKLLETQLEADLKGASKPQASSSTEGETEGSRKTDSCLGDNESIVPINIVPLVQDVPSESIDEVDQVTEQSLAASDLIQYIKSQAEEKLFAVL